MSSNPYAPAPTLRVNEEICFTDIKGKKKPRDRKQLTKLLGISRSGPTSHPPQQRLPIEKTANR